MRRKNEWPTATEPEEIFEAAGRGRELYNLEPPEDALFSRARLIYYQYATGQLTADEGAERRRQAVMIYKEAVRKREFELRWVDHARKLYKTVEAAAAAYIKKPGYSTAGALWQAVSQCEMKIELKEAMRGDFWDGEAATGVQIEMLDMPQEPAADV